MPRDDEYNHDDDDILEGEVVGEYGSDTFVNLPQVPAASYPDDNPTPPRGTSAPPPQQDHDDDRRGFLRRLVIGGVAALALGGGAAAVVNTQLNRTPDVVVLPNGAEVTGQSAADLARLAEQVQELQNENAQLENQLVAAQAERDQVISELDAVRRERDSLQTQLDECLSVVDMWEQHHSVGLDTILNVALLALAPLMGSAMAIVRALSPGLDVARSAVERFTQNFDAPRNGLTWLGQFILGVAAGVQNVRQSVQEAVQPSGGFGELVTDFVLWVLDRLPFNAGANARAGLEAMQNLISILPELVDGVTEDVLEPLGDWFSSDQAVNLIGVLIDPIRDRVFGPADEILAQVRELDEVYRQDLVLPAQDALERREALYQEIAAATAKLRQNLA